jgi:uncharacterized protein YdeI (YjbR/CyaY-like superfamily)
MTSPRAFRSVATLRAWLERNHHKVKELTLRCYKVHAKHRGVTYPEALDEALCFGWIDGVRRAHDGDSFTQRFTPRRPGSNWSSVNIRRAKALEAAGRMHPAGLAAFTARQAYEPRERDFDAVSLRRFRGNRDAWAYFQQRPPGHRRLCALWVMDARREETRAKRLNQLIEYSARREILPALRRPERTRKS